MKLKVALIQDYPPRNTEESLRRGREHCVSAHRLGADIVLFPEMWNNGYALPNGPAETERWTDTALSADGDYVAAFRNLAQELKMAIVLTFLEKSDQKPLNSLAVIDRSGAVVHRYSKTHLCSFGNESACDPGKEFTVTEIDTASGPVKIGTIICFDREFPEAARVLMLRGAELILIPNACELEQNRKAQLICRAFENMTAVAVANYCEPMGNGRSLALSGVAFEYDAKTDTGRSCDQVIAEGGEKPGIVMAAFDLARLRRYRETEVWGNAYRRPELYGPLAETGIAEPFVRKDRIY